jgi:hypothetical protein
MYAHFILSSYRLTETVLQTERLPTQPEFYTALNLIVTPCFSSVIHPIKNHLKRQITCALLFFRIPALYNTDSGIRLMATIKASKTVVGCNLCFIKLSHLGFKLCQLINDNKRTK